MRKKEIELVEGEGYLVDMVGGFRSDTSKHKELCHLDAVLIVFFVRTNMYLWAIKSA